MMQKKQKEDTQRFIEAIARVERPQDKHPDISAFEVRPILPMDLGLGNWVWTSRQVMLRPRWYIVLYGIHSRYLLQVKLKTGGDSAGVTVAAVSTGQLLYYPYFWKKQEPRWVTWEPMENIPDRDLAAIPFSILGFVVEPVGMTIA